MFHSGESCEGRTQPADMSGGSITITNVGVFGVDLGTPIINPGESAIMAFGAIRREPWVVTAADGTESIEPRWVTRLALSFDHRLIDGELGSRFLADVAKVLEDPARGLATNLFQIAAEHRKTTPENPFSSLRRFDVTVVPAVHVGGADDDDMDRLRGWAYRGTGHQEEQNEGERPFHLAAIIGRRGKHSLPLGCARGEVKNAWGCCRGAGE